MTTTAIQLRNIGFHYGTVAVLHHITADIHNGTVVSILGANGSGKTTLLRVMAGLATPNHGQVTLLDRPIRDYSPTQLAQIMAFVPQDNRTPFPFRVNELVLMGRLPHSDGLGFATTDDFTIAEEALRICDAWQFRERRIDELSGGERSRVILARALAQEPQILLLDEPTAFLDIRHQVAVLQVLKAWTEQTGGTVVTVLHDLNLAVQYSSHTLLLKSGTTLAAGPTAETLSYTNACTTFDTDIYVGMNEFTQQPYFVPMSNSLRVKGPV